MGYIEERKRQGEDKRDNGGKPFNDKVCPNIKEGERSTQIVARDRGKECFLPMEIDIERELVLIRGYFFGIIGIEKVYA